MTKTYKCNKCHILRVGDFRLGEEKICPSCHSKDIKEYEKATV